LPWLLAAKKKKLLHLLPLRLLPLLLLHRLTLLLLLHRLLPHRLTLLPLRLLPLLLLPHRLTLLLLRLLPHRPLRLLLLLAHRHRSNRQIICLKSRPIGRLFYFWRVLESGWRNPASGPKGFPPFRRLPARHRARSTQSKPSS
jgi:hypothetical protein